MNHHLVDVLAVSQRACLVTRVTEQNFSSLFALMTKNHRDFSCGEFKFWFTGNQNTSLLYYHPKSLTIRLPPPAKTITLI